MVHLKKYLSFFFVLWIALVLWQCARRGNPTGGPEDVTPPELIRTEPENFSTEFKSNTIRLYFDEYVKLEDVQNQLIISPPLKYLPEVKPQGGVSKYVEVIIKDTLSENTTYTLNFGQSIVDNNEGNPNSFLTYVFSTGTYIDSLTLAGAVKDAYDRKAEEFISVMLYELDTSFTDSTVFKRPPNYISNTLDSLPIFELKNLKAGKYKLIALKDLNKNNLFDQRQDKIGFIEDTIIIPTDSIYLLNLFKEIPDYSASVPSYVAKNRIIFGYQGVQEEISIESLTDLPDSVRTTILKERETDTLNYWLTPTDLDSIIFLVQNKVLDQKDTFTVKTRKLELDSLRLTNSVSGKFGFEEIFSLSANTPIVAVDTSHVEVFVSDSIPYDYGYAVDSVKNQIDFAFEKEPNQTYKFNFNPGAITDFFGIQNDSLTYRFTTGSYADYGNLRVNLSGTVRYPMIVQLTNEQGETQREAILEIPTPVEFNNLEPARYMIRVIFDDNANGIWDTGNYLKKIQPEKVSYYPDIIEVRANWELEQSFIITD
ncbi:Ig-like domain-containing protein [Flagellimonas meridianipacifica]|uniref:Ig-like domain-containing protein n=1 Tax=Flagellimonas meridianipacifica TaxID=1080225 RepID=A0A2T0MGG0_9FLAO|nr:Ig-like domain-containing protein [Allomuricauda pacifica]PRX56667.1 Ig-like domain-containing protein [Allomuricauda pacifica]